MKQDFRTHESAASKNSIPAMARVIASGLLLMIVISVLQFGHLERMGRPFFSAFHARDTADIRETSWREDNNARSRYGMFYALESIAPGSTVWIGTDDLVIEDAAPIDYMAERFYAYGGVERVRSFDGSYLDALGDVDVFARAIAEGNSGVKVAPWVIAVATTAEPEWPSDEYLRKLFAGVDVDTFGPLDFVVVRWPEALAGSEWDYQWLVVDTRLLPAGSWNP